MKLSLSMAAIGNTSAPGQASARTITPVSWIVSSWKVEPVLCSPKRAGEYQIADVNLMNHVNKLPGLSLRLFDPDPALVYSIDEAERLAHVPRRTILIFCRHGLVSPLADPKFDGYYFNRQAIRLLRRIGYLQIVHGVNLVGIKFILDLTGEVQRLRKTVEAHAAPTSSIKSK